MFVHLNRSVSNQKVFKNFYEGNFLWARALATKEFVSSKNIDRVSLSIFSASLVFCKVSISMFSFRTHFGSCEVFVMITSNNETEI